MRHVAALTIVLLLSLPSVMTPQPPTPAPAPPPPDTTLMQLKTKWVTFRRELRSRKMLQKILAQRPDADVAFLASQYGVERRPEFSAWTDDSLSLEIKKVREELMIRNVFFMSNNLKEIYRNPPDTQNPYNPHVEDEQVLELSKSVVAIVHKDMLDRNQENNTWTLKTRPFHEDAAGYGELCNLERFYDAPVTTVRGTGFLVEDDIIATAGHVVYFDDDLPPFLDTYYFVFDYVMLDPSTVKTTYTDDEVFKGSEILVRYYEPLADWALIRLDRVPPNRSGMPYRERGKMDGTETVYMIGHPNGLPQKYAGTAPISNNGDCYAFNTKLDVFRFNSGSPVISDKNDAGIHQVEGIMVVSEFDRYMEYCECFVERETPVRWGGEGAKVTRSTVFAPWIRWPESIVVRCYVPESVIRTFPQEDEVISMGVGGEVTIDCGDQQVVDCDWGVELFVRDNCWMSYPADPGEVWEIVYFQTGAGVNRVEMRKACNP